MGVGGEGVSPLSSHTPANCGPVQVGKNPENKTKINLTKPLSFMPLVLWLLVVVGAVVVGWW